MYARVALLSTLHAYATVQDNAVVHVYKRIMHIIIETMHWYLFSKKCSGR